jgi:MFS family permease
MATGLAIMGFGGGAFVAGFLNVRLIAQLGVATTLMVLGFVYLVIMLAGARLLRRPPAGWTPPGWTPHADATRRFRIESISRDRALGTRQFYLLWGVLFVNVTAGIGILAQASPMMQDLFGRTPAEAATVVSLISLFNAGGRFAWASASDHIGRRRTYAIFFAAQVVLFLLLPALAADGRWLLFEASLFLIFTMYGGGFATIPAFLADIFGPLHVGAIHGAVLTSWSAAAIVGPLVITELSNRAKAALPPGADAVHVYDTPLQVLAGLLVVGFVLTMLVRPLPVEDARESIAP